MVESQAQVPVFTETSAISLSAIAVVGIFAYIGSTFLLPKSAKRVDRYAFVWLAFDAMIHMFFEGPFLYLSLYGRQVITSEGPFAEMWKEYAKADIRWGVSEPSLVSLELLTVFVCGPLCLYILMQLIKDDPTRHYWIVILSMAELYGGWMTFCPEWLTGSPNLDASNFLYFWVYLVFLNMIWVIIPVGLMVNSYREIAASLLLAQNASKSKPKVA